jgi:hypothetical protein
MTKKPIIGSAQLLLMSVGSALIFPYTFMPILTAPPANQTRGSSCLWLSSIFLSSTPPVVSYDKFRGMSANEMIEQFWGRFSAKAAAVIFGLFFIYCFTPACSLPRFSSICIFSPKRHLGAASLYDRPGGLRVL